MDATVERRWREIGKRHADEGQRSSVAPAMNGYRAFMRNAALGAVFIAVWLLLSVLSGAATSGYHLEDDNVVLLVHERLSSGTPFGRVLHDMLDSDMRLNRRFRPVCIATWAAGIALFGDNLVVWSLYRAVLAGVVSCLLYVAGLGLGLRRPYALAFTAIGLAGPQTSVWMMRAPAEGWGTLLLALGLAAMTREFSMSPVRQRVWSAATAICWAAMSLTKESFLVLVPALALLRSGLIASHAGLPWVQANRGRPWTSLALLA